MAGMKSWSTSAASNVLANTGFSMDEGMAPSVVNDSIRQLMADVRTEWAQGADIASAGTTDLSAATGGYVFITGTTTITAFGTASAGIRRKLKFSGALTLTHNATSLILPTGANIITVAGDTCEVMSEGSGNWRVLWYTRAGNFVPLSVIKRKTADESVISSTTLQDDDHLTFPIAANEEWTATFNISCGASLSTTGLKCAITTPAGATLEADATIITDIGGNTLSGRSSSSGGSIINTVAAGFPGAASGVVAGSMWALNSSTAGSITLQWAQGTSVATNLTFRKGSFLQATRVA